MINFAKPFLNFTCNHGLNILAAKTLFSVSDVVTCKIKHYLKKLFF